MQQSDQSLDRALKNVKVLTVNDELFGLPSKLFVTGLGLSIGLGAAIHFLFAPIIAIFYFPVMYHIHKDDPKALTIWIGALKRRKNYWVAGIQKQTKLKILT